MTVDEALDAIREIEKNCPAVACKVVTVEDVRDSSDALLDLTDEEIQASYEFRRWGEMQDWDWDWFADLKSSL